jgi:hypothetical protein
MAVTTGDSASLRVNVRRQQHSFLLDEHKNTPDRGGLPLSVFDLANVPRSTKAARSAQIL